MKAIRQDLNKNLDQIENMLKAILPTLELSSNYSNISHFAIDDPVMYDLHTLGTPFYNGLFPR